METNFSQNVPENPDKPFVCECCDYQCCRRKDLDKHFLTAKHRRKQQETQGNNLSQKIPQTPKVQCPFCGEEYRSRAGLWKHKKLHHPVPAIEECGAIPSSCSSSCETPAWSFSPDRDDFLRLLRADERMRNFLMIEQQTKMLEFQSHMIDQQQNLLEKAINSGAISAAGVTNNLNLSQSNSHNNSHNKTFNLNFFLNETCKNAMNMSEFVESINLELSDLMRVGEVGFVEGISNIIIENLRALDITERPIHCTDKKREIFYVKDANKWEKDDIEKSQIRSVIKKVANKNIRLLPKYKEAHPDCNFSNSRFADQYNKLIVESMETEDIEKQRKIIRNISRQVALA